MQFNLSSIVFNTCWRSKNLIFNLLTIFIQHKNSSFWFMSSKFY
jgi:hypothetical protein